MDFPVIDFTNMAAKETHIGLCRDGADGDRPKSTLGSMISGEVVGLTIIMASREHHVGIPCEGDRPKSTLGSMLGLEAVGREQNGISTRRACLDSLDRLGGACLSSERTILCGARRVTDLEGIELVEVDGMKKEREGVASATVKTSACSSDSAGAVSCGSCSSFRSSSSSEWTKWSNHMTVTMHMANTGSKAVTKTETVPSLASASSRSKKADSVSCKRAIEMFSAKKNNCDNFLPPPSFPFPSGKFCDWGVNLRTFFLRDRMFIK